MAIKVNNLIHIYSEGTPYRTLALDDVSFEISDGETVGIIGHTGSGKSTLIQHLNGLLKPKSGEILIDGLNITKKEIKMTEIRKRVGLVFQYPEYQLFEETVEKDVAFGPKNLGLEMDEVNERVKEAIELVGLEYETIKDKSPFELSGGQKRRVAIAGVIAMKPKLLILDEPTAGLDPKAHKEILMMIKNIKKEQGSTVVFISHNMTDIANFSDRIMVMDKGKLILEGTPKEVFSHGALIKEIGLELPPIMLVVEAINKKGFAIDPSIMSKEGLEEALYKILETKEDALC